MYLEKNPTRMNDAIAERNLARILASHGIVARMIQRSGLPFDEMMRQIKALRVQEPHLSLREAHYRINYPEATDDLIRVADSVFAAEAEIERVAARTHDDYVRDIVHAAYCGCGGCQGRMGRLTHRASGWTPTSITD